MLETAYTLLKISGCVVGYEISKWGVLSVIEIIV